MLRPNYVLELWELVEHTDLSVQFSFCSAN